jgi:hypothetical protein
MQVIIFEDGSSELEEYQVKRLKSLFRELIPPEIGYDILLANDTRTEWVDFTS